MCPVTCGVGMIERTRQCDNPLPANNGSDCSTIGPSFETQNCTKPACPGNFELDSSLCLRFYVTR